MNIDGPCGPPMPTAQVSLPVRVREVRACPKTLPIVKARAAMTAPARSTRNLVIADSLVGYGDAGGISTEHRVGLFREVVTVKDEVGLEGPPAWGTDRDA